MKFADIKEMTGSDLRKQVVQVREEIFAARMKHSLGQLGNPIEIRHRRKDMARLMTAMQMKLGKKK